MLANAVAWVGGEVGGGGALHMLCKVSLLPLLVSTFACNFFKLKRASRSHAKTGICFRCFLVFFSGGFLSVVFRVPRDAFCWLSGASWDLPGGLPDVIFGRISRISRFWG